MSPRAVFLCCASLCALNGYGASLAEALDNPALAWRTGGDAEWAAQTLETHDGIDAAQSGVVFDNGQSWLEVTVTGPGPLSFWWKVSSELGYDHLQFLIDGAEQVSISGEVPWELRAFDIPSGVHILRWRYTKDGSESAGLDRAWLDQVSYTFPSEFAPIIYEQPESRSVAVGATVTFSVSGAGLPEPAYQWFHHTAAVPGGTNAVLNLSGVTSAHAGIYTVTLRNSHGSVTSAPAVLTVTHIGEVLEAPELTWTIGGEGAWFGQSEVTHDGIDALQSGAILNQQESWVQTRVNGPGILIFWWKVSSEPLYDGLQFRTNGVVAASLSGDAEWEQKVINVPPGATSLRWRYFKDGSITLGQDRGWLDEVTYIPNKPPTNLAVSLSRQVIAESDSILLSGSFFDAESSDPHIVVINWQDGSSTTTNLSAGLHSFSAAHQFKDNGLFQILVSVSDEAGSVSTSTLLTVSNAPPRLTNVALTTPIFPHDAATLTGLISDIGPLDTLRLVINWGDGAAPQSFDYPPGGASFALTHVYRVANTNLQITLTATDDDQGASTATTNLFVRPLPVPPRILSLRRRENGNSILSLQGTPFAVYRVQGSPDLLQWSTFSARTADSNGFFEADEAAGFTFQRRFYRALWQPAN